MGEEDIWIRQAEKRVPNISIQIEEHMGDSKRGRGFSGSEFSHPQGHGEKHTGDWQRKRILRGTPPVPGNILTFSKRWGGNSQQVIAPSMQIIEGFLYPTDGPRMISKRSTVTRK